MDSKVVGKEFLDPLRRLVAAEQVTTQSGLRLGGVGVDVEMDEVCFRVQRVKVSRVETRYKVRRYLCAAERATRRYALIELPTREVQVGARSGANLE